QFTNGLIKTPSGGGAGSEALCIGNKKYSYTLDEKLQEDGSNRVLVADIDSSCQTDDPQLGPGSGTELLSPNMRLSELEVSQVAGTNLYNVRLAIKYGDDDLFDGAGNCISSRFGGSFCAQSSLDTTVQ